MSFTRCNFCTLRDLRRFAERTGQPLTLSRLPLTDDEWKDAPGAPYARPMGTQVVIGGVFAAWLWAIPDHCVCYE